MSLDWFLENPFFKTKPLQTVSAYLLLFFVFFGVWRDAHLAPLDNTCHSRFTLGAQSEAVIVNGEAAIEILSRQDLDRGFAFHNRSFTTQKNPSGTEGTRD